MTNLTSQPDDSLPKPTGAVVGAPTAPPHPLDNDWHVHIDGQTYGPFSGHQLGDFVNEGRIDGATQVLLVGSTDWLRAAEEPKLAAIFRASRTPPPPPPVTAAPGATVVQVTQTVTPSVIVLDDDSSFGPKSPALALVLSLLFPGLGQIYCGRVGRGFLFLIGCILAWLALLGWIIWIWSIVDAYNIAKKMNLRYLRRLQLMQPQ